MLYFKSPNTFGYSQEKLIECKEISNAISNLNNQYGMPLVDQQSVPDLSNSIINFFGSPITVFRIFYYPEYYATKIHIDGTNSNPVEWAINFPIFGTNNSLMEWAKVKPGLNMDHSYARQARSKAVKFEDDDIEYWYPEKLELDAPYIVNTKIPHRGLNNKNSPRAILSVRVGLSYTKTIEEIFELINKK